jgi:hypothetical protein
MTKLLLVCACLVSCATTPTPQPSQAPTTLAYCQYQEGLHSTELAAVAHQLGAGAEEIDTEFVSACVSRVDGDMAEIVKDLGGIKDAGGDAK